MAKLGDFEFPEVGLIDSVDLARRIYDELGGEVSRDGLAMVLDMSPGGGAYGARIGALRLWGLVTGRSVIRLTADGIRAVSSLVNDDGDAVVGKLARSVPLFNEIADRIGDSSVDQRVLAVMLQEITDAEMDEVMRRIAMVERIYGGIKGFLDADSYTDADTDVAVPTSDDRAHGSYSGEPARLRGWIEFRYDDGSLTLRETVENLDVLIGVLESRKRRFMTD